MSHRQDFLEQAVALALFHMTANQGGPFGAIIARGPTLIARGWNQVTSHNDPTAHAEVVAIREACRHLGRFQLQGLTLYASCEPCPMCLAACYWARLDGVWFACGREEAKAAGFDDDFLYTQFTLPATQRTLPVRRLALPGADQPFRAWLAKADRVLY